MAPVNGRDYLRHKGDPTIRAGWRYLRLSRRARIAVLTVGVLLWVAVIAAFGLLAAIAAQGHL